MTIYGNTSRVSVDLQGGGVSGVSEGIEQKVLIFARGDTTGGSVSANTPTQISGPGALTETFGSDQPIVTHLQDAAANGVSYDNLWGVVPEQITETAEDITGGGDAADHTTGDEIANAPIVEDTSLITVEDDTGTTMTVEFRYETNKDSTNSDFTSLSPGADTMFINPVTGEWVADTSDDYNIDYDYLDFDAAFDGSTEIIEEQEVGGWWIDTESESVLSSAQGKADPLRKNEWKMVRVHSLARPNQTGSDDGAEINASDFTLGVDSDYTFAYGPGRRDSSIVSVIGAIAGVTGGNAIDDPIIGDELLNIDSLEQGLSVPNQETLEGEKVIPLSNAGNPSIEGNLSTSTSTDWLRSYFARRLADRLILAARAIAKDTRGKLNSEQTEQIVEEQLADEIIDLIDQNVLKPNVQGESDRWFVSADQDPNNVRELDVSFGFTPTGVVDVVDVGATINY